MTPAGSVSSVSSSQNPSLPGASVIFTCTVSTIPLGSGAIDGAVQFKIDGANVGAPVSIIGGAASHSAVLTLGSHSVQADYLGSANITASSATLSPAQLINTPPVATSDVIERGPTNGTKVAVAALLANDLDADADTLSFVSCPNLSAKGATLTVNNGWIFYVPPPALTENDTFDYSITDGRGAAVIGTVTVNVVNAGVSSNLSVMDVGSGAYKIRLDGVPNARYRLQYTTSLNNPIWTDLTNGTTDDSGALEYIDSAPSSQRYYRSVSP